jgi:hypothetical protein
MPQMLSKLSFLTLERRRPRFVVGRHRAQPARGLDMRKLVRNPATAFGMIKQGALFDTHLATTPNGLNGPSLVLDSLRNSAGEFREKSVVDRNVTRRMTLKGRSLRDNAMNDVSQLATAMLAIAFAAMLLLTGQWFVDYRVQREATSPIVAMRFMQPVSHWTAPSTARPATKPGRPSIGSGV